MALKYSTSLSNYPLPFFVIILVFLFLFCVFYLLSFFVFLLIFFVFFCFFCIRPCLLPLLCLNLIRTHFASLFLSLLLFVVFCFSSWDDSSYHYCWCDLFCQWKSKLGSSRCKLHSLKNPPSPPASMFQGQLGRGSGSLKYCQSNIDSGGWRGAVLRVEIKIPGQASCCPSCNWQNKSHQQSPLFIFSNTSPTRRGMSSVLITFWENGKPIELRP